MKLNDTDERDEFIKAYITCMLWSTNDESTPSGGEPMDANYSEEDLHPDTLRGIISECCDFINHVRDELEIEELPGWTASQAGHDFWLTRNGHGTGFWDRYYKGPWVSLGDWLKEQVGFRTDFPEQNPYVGDDGKIYI